MGPNVVSGARDQIRDLFTSGPLGATLSPLRYRITPERRGATTRPIGYVPCLATLWRRFRAGGRTRAMSIALERKRHLERCRATQRITSLSIRR